jgi:ubiquitin
MPLDPSDSKNRRQIEDRLQNNVADARVRFEAARARSCRLLDAAVDLGRTHSDGTQATKNGRRPEARATRDYCEAVTDLAEYVFHGRMLKRVRDSLCRSGRLASDQHHVHGFEHDGYHGRSTQ